MEWGCMGFLLGALVTLVFFGLGVCCGRERDKDVSNKKRQYSDEEKVFVLNELKRSCSGYEREIVEQIIDDYEKGAKNE